MTELEKAFIDTDPAEIGAVRYLAHLQERAKLILQIANRIGGCYSPTTADGLKALELALMIDRIQSDGGNLDKFIEEVKAEQESIKAGCKHDR